MKLLLLITLGVVAIHAEQSQTLKDYSIGYTKFAGDIYKELLKSNSGNFLVCPLSVQVILALVNYGAKGKTLQQLSSGLHLPEDKEQVKQIFRELSPHLQGNDKYTLTTANKIYLKHGFEIIDDFKSTAVDVFKADIQNINFKPTDKAADEINRWIEEQTHNKIKDVISKGDLSADDTAAVLVNAIYFHGKWITQFKEEDTKKRSFHINNKDDVQVDMMEVTEHFNYYESPELKAKFLELPYEGGEVTMTFVLPYDVESLPALEARIEDVIGAQQLRREKVHVVVPKFKVESKIQFKPILQALGVDDAFEDYADFTELSRERTKISKIIHKAFIEVEEKGTTAAAATVVVQNYIRSGHAQSYPPKEFIADHAFIYYLKSPAGVMFVGRYIKN